MKGVAEPPNKPERASKHTVTDATTLVTQLNMSPRLQTQVLTATSIDLLLNIQKYTHT